MDCENVKQLIKNGDAQSAREHISGCPDCMAFESEFAELAQLLESVPGAEENEMLLEKTIRLAKAELAKPAALHAPARGRNVWAAAAFAALFAPALIAANYLVAEAGRALLSDLFFPAFGAMFFASYAAGAMLAMGLAYGSLPIIISAAGNTLKVPSYSRGGFST